LTIADGSHVAIWGETFAFTKNDTLAKAYYFGAFPQDIAWESFLGGGIWYFYEADSIVYAYSGGLSAPKGTTYRTYK